MSRSSLFRPHRFRLYGFGEPRHAPAFWGRGEELGEGGDQGGLLRLPEGLKETNGVIVDRLGHGGERRPAWFGQREQVPPAVARIAAAPRDDDLNSLLAVLRRSLTGTM